MENKENLKWTFGMGVRVSGQLFKIWNGNVEQTDFSSQTKIISELKVEHWTLNIALDRFQTFLFEIQNLQSFEYSPEA